jgi:flagellar basal-body rod protein FlgC
MSLDRMFGAINISASGASAERLRMEVVANNIANASSTRTPQGGPYRRYDVVFAAVLNQRLEGRTPEQEKLGGVRVLGMVEDRSELPRVYQPGHPDADADGMVTMPNVKLPIEMVNLVTATRAHEANLRMIQTFRDMAEQSISLIRR